MKQSVEKYDRNRNIDENELTMEEVTTQLNVIVDQLKKLTEAQVYQEERLNLISQKVEEKPQENAEVTHNKTLENVSAVDLFRIPDPIKSIPHFDGNKKQLAAWLKTAEDTLLVFQPLVTIQQFSLYVQAVMNKIEGKAKDILCLAGNPQTFLEIKEILLDALGDRQELSYYKSQLWANKQSETMTVHTYFKKIKETVQNIKALARQNKLYSGSWPAISAFIEEDALAAFISGLRKPYFGYAQAAKPKDIEEAYAFLCKFSSNELISSGSKKLAQTSYNPQKTNLTNSNQYRINTIKNNEFIPTNHRKQTYSVKEPPIPMEVDQSIRSRRTFNKNSINNHEITQQIEDNLSQDRNENNSDETQEEGAGNFQVTQSSDTED